MVFVYTGQNNVNAGDPGPDTPCTNRNCQIKNIRNSYGPIWLTSVISHLKNDRLSIIALLNHITLY